MELKELSALDIHYLLKSYMFLLGARVDNIYQNDKIVYFIFHIPSKGKKILKVILPNFIYLTEIKDEMPLKPQNFCVILRKYIKNSHLTSIEQIGFERIIKLSFKRKDQTFIVFIELIPPGNVILCNQMEKIIYPLEHQKWKDRIIKSGLQYVYPKKDINVFQIDANKLKDLMNKSDKQTIVHFLAVDLGFGGKYAEEICKESGTDKKIKPSQADPELIFNSISNILSKQNDNLNEILEKQLTEKSFLQEKANKEKIHEEKKSKSEKIIKAQEMLIKKLNEEISLNNQKGDLIYQNYSEIKRILDDLKELRKKYSWQEIKEKLKNHKIIKKIDENAGKITLEL